MCVSFSFHFISFSFTILIPFEILLPLSDDGFCGLHIFCSIISELNFFIFIQSAAVEALKHFVPTYLTTANSGGSADITLKYLELLTDPNVAVRRGSALAIGALPSEFLAKRWKLVLPKLCSSCEIEVHLIEVFFQSEFRV